MKCVITNFTFKVGNTDKMQLVSGTMSFISKFGVISPKVQKVSWLSSQTAHNFLQPNSFNLSMAFFVAFFRWQKGSCASSSSSCSSSRSHSGLRKKKVRHPAILRLHSSSLLEEAGERQRHTTYIEEKGRIVLVALMAAFFVLKWPFWTLSSTFDIVCVLFGFWIMICQLV